MTTESTPWLPISLRRVGKTYSLSSEHWLTRNWTTHWQLGDMATQQIDVLESWGSNAAFWDENIGPEGNKYWKVLQRPCLERLIDFKPGCKALDLACGNGLVTRWLAERCSSVVATDGSGNMLTHAIRRCPDEQKARVTFKRLDVTQSTDLEGLANSDLMVSSLWKAFFPSPLTYKGRWLRYRDH